MQTYGRPPPVARMWSDSPVVCSAAMRSLYCASSTDTTMGCVHKSRGNTTVLMCLQAYSHTLQSHAEHVIIKLITGEPKYMS